MKFKELSYSEAMKMHENGYDIFMLGDTWNIHHESALLGGVSIYPEEDFDDEYENYNLCGCNKYEKVKFYLRLD